MNTVECCLSHFLSPRNITPCPILSINSSVVLNFVKEIKTLIFWCCEYLVVRIYLLLRDRLHLIYYVLEAIIVEFFNHYFCTY